ncbi:Txe/YoeB family addiction module toxin [Demequina flava]|uniref:Txe/YoeB family addiction module toxin n=1 Tax=Demequina flava TaxID=1095025 RepID=UPI0007820475|nr:Txe/YoeB family addiction module toxin [Demequina flava]
MKLVWDHSAWQDYLYWQTQDRKTLKRINTVVRDVLRGAEDGDPHTGIGKPEQLKHGLSGYWSRRISDEHRLVYKVVDDELRIAACRYHYSD